MLSSILGKYLRNIICVIIILCFTFILFSPKVSAFKSVPPEIGDNLSIKTVSLDDDSLEELIYISSDYSILVFRRVTPQLERLSVGDILFLDAGITKNHHFLGQIINIIREDIDQKGMIIHMTPWRENHSPVISSLIAQPSILEVGQQSRLTCYAADQEGDALFYDWHSNKGLLLGTGATVTWQAPHQPGDYFISCEVIDNRGGEDNRAVRIQVVERLPLLTYQERELIRQFGWGHNHTIRWPDGYVAVYDSTNFSGMQKVINEWNKVIGGKVIFYLSYNSQSPVKISYNYQLSRKNLCYHIDTHWRNYQLYAAEIQINPESQVCGFPRNLYAAYLHSFSGVVGFNIWQGTTIKQEDWQDFTQISEIIERMLKALYKVPPGYDLN